MAAAAVVILDTCVWISLAETPSLLPLVDVLKTAVSSGKYVLHVPASVRREFDRNRPEIEQRATKAFKGHMSSARTLKDLLPKNGADIDALIKAAEDVISARGAQTLETVREVDGLVTGAKQCAAGEKDYEEACSRCLDVKPPAHRRNRSAVGDCLLWLAVLRHLGQYEVLFCSTNTNDFSGTRNDELHEALASEAKQAKNQLTFFHDPSALMRHLDTAGTRLPDYFQEVPPFNIQNCPRCGSSLSGGAYLRSQYGGLTYQRLCTSCGVQIDTGESFD